jgi:hypothetical protein
LDTYAAFSVLYGITGEAPWQTGLLLASNFVESMWETNRGSYLAGTTGGTSDSRNQATNQLPLDTQTWTILAIPGTLQRHPDLLSALELFHQNQHDGFTGEDFNDDRDGVWFEGTGQTAVDYASVGNAARMDALRSVLWTAQQIPPPYGDGMGIPAASRDGVTSGFSFTLFRRPHVGATSWNIFAQKGFNPFYQTRQPVFLQSPTLVSNLVAHTLSFQLQSVSEPGRSLVMQMTTNLVQWTPFATNAPPSGDNTVTQQWNPAARSVFFRGIPQ